MRRIACIFLLTCTAATPLAAQTRNVAHASHSGSGMAEDEDHFGETPQMKAMWRHYSDSVRNAEQAAAQQHGARTDSPQKQADDAAPRRPLKRVKKQPAVK